MNEMIEEVQANEALKPIFDDLNDRLDAEGAQENDKIEKDGIEEIAGPILTMQNGMMMVQYQIITERMRMQNLEPL